MQLFRVILAVICLPATAAAQDISGLWTGYLSTTEKTLPYEVVINKKNGTWVAYSHISFNVNGKDITSVKKLKVLYEYRHLTLEDDDLLKDNFDKAAPKKISQTSELDFRQHGKQMVLEGTFKTKRTRSLRPAEGVIVLYKNPDPVNAEARIQPELKELQLDDALAVFKPLPPVADVAVNEPVKEPEPVKVAAPAPTPGKEPVVAATKPAVVPKPAPVTVAATRPAVTPAPAPEKQPSQVPVKPAPVVASAPPPPLPLLPAVDMSNRKIDVIDNITVYSDSLVFSIYDNGEVDGDTVSVVLNGRTIMSKQRLSAKALTQTVYLTPDLGDTLEIVMYAENMGLYPPNTGLLILQDGNRRREVRFSGDLKKNAAIMLHRAK
ncbi:MAG: hypothetical protein QM687_04060 [Ferruginibacter sp.]